jgi:hypothetical protein
MITPSPLKAVGPPARGGERRGPPVWGRPENVIRFPKNGSKTLKEFRSER